MGNRTTEWTFARGPIHIYVYPLAIPGQLGEVVDHLLGHLERRTQVTELGREPIQGVDVIETGRVHRLDSSSEDRASLDVAVRREDVPADRHAPRPLADAIEAKEGAGGRRLHTMHRSANDLSAVCRSDVGLGCVATRVRT